VEREEESVLRESFRYGKALCCSMNGLEMERWEDGSRLNPLFGEPLSNEVPVLHENWHDPVDGTDRTLLPTFWEKLVVYGSELLAARKMKSESFHLPRANGCLQLSHAIVVAKSLVDVTLATTSTLTDVKTSTFVDSTEVRYDRSTLSTGDDLIPVVGEDGCRPTKRNAVRFARVLEDPFRAVRNGTRHTIEMNSDDADGAYCSGYERRFLRVHGPRVLTYVHEYGNRFAIANGVRRCDIGA
jgi:hypothetical protein